MNIGTCELLDGSGAISMKQDIEKPQTRPLLEVSADLSSIYIYIYIYICIWICHRAYYGSMPLLMNEKMVMLPMLIGMQQIGDAFCV